MSETASAGKSRGSPNDDSPLLSQVLAFWQAARNGRSMPAPADIAVFDLAPEILAHLAFADVGTSAEPLFRWHLMGTRVAAELGDQTREDDCAAQPKGSISAMLTAWAERAVREKIPVRMSGQGIGETLLLPLSRDGTNVEVIMALIATATGANDIPRQRDIEEDGSIALATVSEHAPMGIVISRRDGGEILFVNPLAAQMLGLSEDQLVGRTVTEFYAEPKERASIISSLSDNAAAVRKRTVLRRADSQEFTALLHLSPMKYGETDAVLTFVEDISEQDRSERELAGSYQLLQSLIDGMPEFIALKDGDGRYLFVNRVFEEWYAVDRKDAIGKTMYDFLPKEEADTYAAEESMAASDQTVRHREVVARWRDGVERNTIMIRFPVFDADGNIVARGSSARDVTEFRRAEAEAAKAQAQLRQAQKMEAVGQLTGGVAHDFNNLLAAIMGNLELLITRAGDDPMIVKFADRAMAAGSRGAELTHRLLAFSRRQALDPKPTNINHLVAGMRDLLDRSLEANIQIHEISGSGLWLCEIDPGQMENAILNLSINARDAMPQGGRLTIETSNVHMDAALAQTLGDAVPGDYVLLTISDTGTGMPPVLIEQAFDPFFTTKRIGEGSGLGLSMVYGFVRQSGGYTRILSTEGQGTTIELYLPKSNAPAQQADQIVETPPARAKPGETVMVVEDDEDVRAVNVSFLEGFGYRVFEAGTADDAMAQMQPSSRIDLLLTDIVLPGSIDGRELAARVQGLMPETKILFMSGYAQNHLDAGSGAGSGIRLLKKPFVGRTLAEEVRQVLDTPIGN